MSATPNWAALGYTGKPKLDYEKHAAGWRVRFEREQRMPRDLPLDQLRGLPEVDDDSEAGVYFMWHGPVLVYVGQSNCIADRMYQHWNKRRSRTTWLVCNNDAIRRGVEAGYVRRYKPPFNRTSHG